MRNLLLLLILFSETALLNAQSDTMSLEIIIDKLQKTQLILGENDLEKVIINQKDFYNLKIMVLSDTAIWGQLGMVLRMI